MKRLAYFGLGTVFGLGMLALAAQAPSQDAPSSKTLADADATIYALTLRVEGLENRLDQLEAGGAQIAAVASAGAPVMKVESIETVQPDEQTMITIRQLELDVTGLDQQASAMTTAAASITIDNDPDTEASVRNSSLRQQASLKSQAGDYRRQAKQKREEIKKLSAPHQIIKGWSGKKSVELRTERDLSAMLKDVRIGSFVTAKGTLLDADDSSATAVITSITVVSAPANFTDRPK